MKNTKTEGNEGEEVDVDKIRAEVLKRYRDQIQKIRRDIEGWRPGDKIEHFKNVKIPAARIKKIMKTDEEVKMISMEAPALFSKACELFILELTHKANFYAKKSSRKCLQTIDLAFAATESESFDFLMDLISE